MLIELKPAEEQEDFALISELANGIWQEHYEGIIDPACVKHLLATRHTPEAISGDVQLGYRYRIVLVDKEPAGYISYLIDLKAKEIFINKFHLCACYRGRQIGRYMLNAVEHEASRNACRKIWMVVNQKNRKTLAACERMGFLNKGPRKTDVGNGYVMDDYYLVKVVTFGTMLSVMES